MEIVNVLYPRLGKVHDHEVERLDGIPLSPGLVLINRCKYRLTSLGPPEYSHAHASQRCGQVTYRWLKESVSSDVCIHDVPLSEECGTCDLDYGGERAVR